MNYSKIENVWSQILVIQIEKILVIGLFSNLDNSKNFKFWKFQEFSTWKIPKISKIL